MSAKLFDEILAKGIRQGQVPARTDEARKWFRKTASTYRSVNETALLRSGKDRLVNYGQVRLGSMYMYTYDAKHKATLPYWDRFPLVFPFKKVKGGHFGINMHYLPPPLRAKLMDALYDITNNDKYDETTKLELSYDVLNKASQFKWFRPCVKHYLASHMRSRFFLIYPAEWDVALFLPTARWQKATAAQVYADSRKLIK